MDSLISKHKRLLMHVELTSSLFLMHANFTSIPTLNTLNLHHS